MIKLHPDVPADCQVFGFIYWHEIPRARGEDMVDVQLPNGLLVSCGWYPEGDANGSYRITASEGFHDLRRIETKSVYEAVFLVGNLARLFNGSFVAVSETDSPAVNGPLAPCA